MFGGWRFSVINLFGLVAVAAAALGLTRFLLSALPPVETSPAAICFLFLEAAVAIYVWALFVCDVFRLAGGHGRWRNLGLAVLMLMLLLVSYSMFLPA
jgi:hypothetical protein